MFGGEQVAGFDSQFKSDSFMLSKSYYRAAFLHAGECTKKSNSSRLDVNLNLLIPIDPSSSGCPTDLQSFMSIEVY